MKYNRMLRALAVAVSSTIMLAACVGGGGSGTGGAGGADGGSIGVTTSADENTLTIWHFETADSAMGQAWAHAVEIFQAEHPDVEVTVEIQTFEGIQRNAGIILRGNDVPDALLFNKGNASAGQLAVQGLIQPLDHWVEQYGWDSIVTGALQTTSRYDENGQMGSGHWYGIPNNGEFVGMYYNRTMFEAAGIAIPTTSAELESVFQTFLNQGITPVATAGGEHPLGQIWYQLVLNHADRSLIDSYQLFTTPMDFHSAAMVAGTNDFKRWVAEGFIAADAVALTAEDMGVSFINGTFPMMFSGSWWFGRLTNEMSDDWGMFLFPESEFALGSAGNLWTIPTNASSPNLAAAFIDITLREEVQNIFAQTGGLPIHGDIDAITDPRAKELTLNFQTLLNNDSLAFYPDWPVAGFNQALVAETQALMNGSKTAEQALDGLQQAYNQGR